MPGAVGIPSTVAAVPASAAEPLLEPPPLDEAFPPELPPEAPLLPLLVVVEPLLEPPPLDEAFPPPLPDVSFELPVDVGSSVGP
jgi:hypothetical protein